MSKKSIGTGITRLLFGLKGKQMKVIPYNEMSPQQFEELDRFLGKLGFILSSDKYTLTKQQSDYVLNQIKQLDLYRERIMSGKNPDFKDFIPRENLGIPSADKAREFKGFNPKVIQGGKPKIIQPKNAKKDVIDANENLAGGANYAKGDTKYNADVLADEIARARGLDPDELPTKDKIKLYGEAYDYLTEFNRLNKPKTRPGKINYDKMSEGLGGVKLRGDETFEELLEIEKKNKNKDPEDFAGGGLATAIAKIKGKYGKEGIMKGKVKKKSDKQKRREMFEEFNKRNKEREEFIFGGGVGLKNLIKSIAKKQDMDKPSDVLKRGNPKSQVPKRAKPFVSDKDMADMNLLRIQQLENKLELLKTGRNLLANRDNFPPQFREVGDDMVRMMMPPEMKQMLKGSTVESLDREILQIENVLKNLKVGRDKRALNADGGLATMFRPRLKDGGPPNPSRRTFLKLMAGLASIPIVGKLFKPAATVSKVVPLKNTTTTMPTWFPDFVDKMVTKNVGNKIDADVTLYKDKELPGVELYKYDDGRIEVQGKNAYDAEYDINYTPPGVEVLDYQTGKSVKTPGDFEASDTVYRQTGPEPDDYDVDGEIVDDIEDILGGNSTQLEGYAKGTGETKYTRGQYQIDEAEARLERADDVTPYKDVDPTDFADPEDVQDFAKGGLATMFRKK
jgi:hypothetical protein